MIEEFDEVVVDVEVGQDEGHRIVRIESLSHKPVSLPSNILKVLL